MDVQMAPGRARHGGSAGTKPRKHANTTTWEAVTALVNGTRHITLSLCGCGQQRPQHSNTIGEAGVACMPQHAPS